MNEANDSGVKTDRPVRGRLVVDIDGTLCPIKRPGEDYGDLVPADKMVGLLREYQAQGFIIVLYTSRNMRTYGANIGLINKHTLPNLVRWLDKWKVPYDEIFIGKPWPGEEGFYVDDRSVRPDEFLKYSHAELEARMAESRARVFPDQTK